LLLSSPVPTAADAAPSSAPPPPAPPPPPAVPEALPAPVVVAVLDLKPSPGAEAQASALTTMLTAEVAAQPATRAISRNELRAILSHQAGAQLAGCAEVQCMADVAALVSATRIVSGEVQKLEGATALSLTLVDTAGGEARVVARQEAVWRGSDDELLLLARPLSQRLFDAAHAAEHTGAVELFTDEGARVVLDGRDVGTAPLPGPLRDLATGAHRLELTKDGYLPRAVDVVVARNETTLARAALTEIALTDEPWFWWTAGGVVLVAGGAAAGIAALALSDRPTTVVVGK
jgi:hypothetical protein